MNKKGGVAIRQEWKRITEEKDKVITFETIKDLAEKYDCKFGKWIFHPSNRWKNPSLEEIWQKVVLELAHNKFPPGVIAVKVSPINDIDIPGASAAGGKKSHDHIVCVINKDMNDEKEIFDTEKVLRSIPINCSYQVCIWFPMSSLCF